MGKMSRLSKAVESVAVTRTATVAITGTATEVHRVGGTEKDGVQEQVSTHLCRQHPNLPAPTEDEKNTKFYTLSVLGPGVIKLNPSYICLPGFRTYALHGLS
jgi:hypothetical protein